MIYLRRRGADIVFVNSTDRRIFMTISNLNTTTTLHLLPRDIDQESVENIMPPKNCSLCQDHVTHQKDHETCSVVSFEKNYFYEEGITVMVEQILANLQWKSVIIFYENSTGMLKIFYSWSIFLQYFTMKTPSTLIIEDYQYNYGKTVYIGWGVVILFIGMATFMVFIATLMIIFK